MSNSSHHVAIDSPFPWFGGKSRVAKIVWSRFETFNSRLSHYIEPFLGGGSVLLARPGGSAGTTETVNDADCLLINFWRAARYDTSRLAEAANDLSSEIDLMAKHKWLVAHKASLRKRLIADPHYFDVEVAGWWVWGQCVWVGSGWCHDSVDPGKKKPRVGHRTPIMDVDQIKKLRERLKHVHVLCGDWSDAVTDCYLGISTHGKKATHSAGSAVGVFLDPPYSEEAGYGTGVYASDDTSVAHAVRQWAIKYGEIRNVRIALCGYEGEHAMPAGWKMWHWKSIGGFGVQGFGRGRANQHRERVWFSPYCLDSVKVERCLL